MDRIKSCEPTVRGEIKKARAGNYDLSACFFEFIDNALDAGADRIRIEIKERSSTRCPHKFIISDNAPHGISLENLSSIFCWTFERKREDHQVGEYGTGFKTAAVNLADKLLVLTSFKKKCFQAVADWQDMADENRWAPQVMEIANDYFSKAHPFPCGSSFTLEMLRNEMFTRRATATTSCSILHGLFDTLFHDISYHYRYILHENINLNLTLKGMTTTTDLYERGNEERDLRSHELFQHGRDPFSRLSKDTNEFVGQWFTIETLIRIYQDAFHFYHVYFENPRTKQWEQVEFIEKRKNGNSVLKCHPLSVTSFDHLRLVDHLTFRTIVIGPPDDRDISSAFSSGTIDLVRKGRIMGRDISLRAPRHEPLPCFVKHEVWYHSHAINPLLGVQFNKQNLTNHLRDNELRHTMEHLQLQHERECIKQEKQWNVPVPPPRENLTITTTRIEKQDQEAVVTTPTAPPPCPEDEANETAGKDTCFEKKRKSFPTAMKIEVLKKQQCRDGVLDFVLKPHVLLADYDHKNGEASENDVSNCQILSVITHALKTRCPERYQKIEQDASEKVHFVVELLNCLTRSTFFLEAWRSDRIQVRESRQDLLTVQQGLFYETD